jgi:hypothetical protein
MQSCSDPPGAVCSRRRPRPPFPVLHTRFRLVLLLVIVAGLITPVSVPPVYAMDSPTPMWPADGTTATAANYAPLGIPEFGWTAVIGATKYRLQISQDIGFATTIDFTTANTRYTPTTASQFPDQTWYWRVRVETPTAGSYSGVMSFTKQWASPDNTVTLIAPAENAALDFYELGVFKWQPAVGAASYRLQIAACGDFSSPIYNVVTLATTHQPPN